LIKIKGKLIGERQPCFIVAEAGINHNGDIDLAKKLISIAKNAGADAVKFQTFKAEELVRMCDRKLFEVVKSLELGKKEFEEIAKYATDKGIIFLSTPTDNESVDLLCELDTPAFKVASCDMNNIPLLKYIAEKGLPIIISTGMATLGEIEEALNTVYLVGNRNVALLHCVSSYPASIEHVNLKAMGTLKQAFQVPVGFSDHTTSTIIPIAAAALGANIIEKHFTINKDLPGPDHKASASPEELKQIVRGIREMERALGSSIKKVVSSERKSRKVMRRSIVARVDIPKGKVITKKMLAIKRPATGIPPKFEDAVIGKVAKRDIKVEEDITWELLGNR